MNTIIQDQLTPKQLDRLAAQRQIYSDVKTIQAVYMILSVPCVIVWSLLIVFIPELTSYAALWGITVTLLGIVIFTPWQNSLKQQAAKIQELFDCDVLQLKCSEMKVSRKPDTETIVEASSKFRRKEPEYVSLKNWYPVSVGKLPIALARLVCQRTNCWWDAKLRRRYAMAIIIVVIILTIFVFLLSLIGGFSLDKFILAVLTPLMPIILLGTQHYIENTQSATLLDDLKESTEKLWEQAISGKITLKILETESRELQDEIYHHRCKSPLIFDWIYRIFRNPHEEQMNKGADSLIEEALKSQKVWQKKFP
ncbi:hypothetical protein PN36_14585 [Candidatus Thiomargarita nelsonii]|uniref:Uncharacterized protein n=1 Tax=Candidatus Thiomargarita nelsonii TaxID=1003181 RepID=A0A0A6RYT6_9GAMM|nr:hypothetical protein PN36_14585 [Candidatus Thiomargarita nelsonii]